MKKNGVEIVNVPEENLKAFYKAAHEAHQQMTGKLYSQELLDRVTNAVQEFRAEKAEK
ncbi:hypothetical protein GWN91_02020 [Candidatus Saccharibacteria bacterium]|nr:hypothetical protein [Candidatus Saccharibacteria bacterium]NIW78515.1 hypothetical protein [Calditrichia bacterium]